MKLIIDIPEEEYKRSKLAYNYDSRRMDKYSRIIGKGIPLDDVKAEIRAEQEKYSHPLEIERAIEILDNIGNPDMRGKT